ncbi:hypothetical protein KIH87_09740 [Paraneptunicella aestuarii]|uniref:hypothetical protein n=1 Tax=Paraneptunicella aestuarii TaxID=2831148 RepID=UPI001E628071|nr:hypothetical protein [Paraneptunicella aestuarii]UAA40593.1 hypothetical protein KIH87_09740 [Paraneptunicella aestuarii]
MSHSGNVELKSHLRMMLFALFSITILFSVSGYSTPIIVDNAAFSQSASAPQSAQNTGAGSCHQIQVFTRQGCPHCAKAKQYFALFAQQYPNIQIQTLDVQQGDNLEQLRVISQRYGIANPGVPTFRICDAVMVGFDEQQTPAWITQQMAITDVAATRNIHLPLFGDVAPEKLGLPLFTVVIGLVDGFNPCAMWVLLFLLSILVNLKDRIRMAVIAGSFVLVSGLVYFAFMAAWLNVFLILGYSRNIQIVLGAIAFLISLIHIKDYFAFKQGISLSIPESAKPGLYSRVRKIVQAENLWLAFPGIIVVAVLVNFLELLCTAGLPAVFTQILTAKSLHSSEYYAYLTLYNIAYIFDDSVMVVIAVYSLNKIKMNEAQGRGLKLLSGIFILALSLGLLFFPEVLF